MPRAADGIIRSDRPHHVDQPLPDRSWERQLPGESFKAFQAFKIYRDQGADRTVIETDREYRKVNGRPVPEKLRRPSGRLNQWAWSFRWQDRAAAFDEHQDQLELTAQRRARIKAATRHAEAQEKVQQVLLHPVAKMEERLLAILNDGRADQLDDLSDEELIRLGRHTAALLTQSQDAEREALSANVDTGNLRERRETLQLRGKVIRKVLANKDLLGMLEEVSFELSANEAATDSLAAGQ